MSGKKVLGLDLGITSIGYSVLDELERDRYSLVDYGVSMFDRPTNNKGESKKLEHSKVASTSNLYHLRKKRKKAVATLFEEFGLGDRDYFLHQERQNSYSNKWELRAKKAFEAKLSYEELFTIFYALAKHRGYKSLESAELLEELIEEKLGIVVEIEDKKSKEEKKEQGKIKQALQDIEKLKKHHPNKTVAQLIYEKERQKPTPTFRNHDNYTYMIKREYIAQEIEKILQTQESFGAFEEGFDTQDFVDKLKAVIVV